MIKELAAKAGLNAGSISNYLKENSSIPSADIAVKIAGALNVSVEYLVTGKRPITKSEKIYSPEIRRLADKLEAMSERDRKIAGAVINAICENPRPEPREK